MKCRNCGAEIAEGSTSCLNCGASVYSSEQLENDQPGNKQSGILQLIFSILETLSCSIFGIIALVLYFVNLKPALDKNDLVKIKSSKKVINILLIIGVVLPLALVIIAMLMYFLLPNASVTQQSMQVRADKATAAQIGKATRIWYIDATTDSSLGMDYNELSNGFIKYSELDNINNYISTCLSPISYDSKYSKTEGAYYVTISDDSSSGKIAVAIGPEGLNNNPSSNSALLEIYTGLSLPTVSANYDGTKLGIAYIEP